MLQKRECRWVQPIFSEDYQQTLPREQPLSLLVWPFGLDPELPAGHFHRQVPRVPHAQRVPRVLSSFSH